MCMCEKESDSMMGQSNINIVNSDMFYQNKQINKRVNSK